MKIYSEQQQEIAEKISPDATKSNWTDWKWQLRHSITDIKTVEQLLNIQLDPEKRRQYLKTMEIFPMSVTPYYLSLIDTDDFENDPIFKQAVPLPDELDIAAYDMKDPLSEDEDSPASGITHRYPDRVLFHVSNTCSMYCRHCTRKRKVGDADCVPSREELQNGLDYIRNTPQVRDVLLSGGDPFMLPDHQIDWLLEQLRAIEHVEIIRIGSRMPVVLPYRITDNLVNILKKHHPLWLNTHFNHPRELTRSSRKALAKLADAGIPVPEFRRVDTPADLRAAGEDLGWPLMLKAREGGYDGRGNRPVEGPEEAEAALEEIGGAALAEELIDFEREVAIMGVVGDGDRRAYPVTETIHREEILRESVTPARTDEAVRSRAREVAFDVLELLEGRGVYGIELFETREGGILVNEIAPRPHNSGHWTIEGAACSQFEQHLRAVLGWPLGGTELRAPAVTANLLGDVDEPGPVELSGGEAILEADAASLHWYGKREARPLRKMGHVTLVDDVGGDTDGEDGREALLSRARALVDATTFA